MARIFEQKQGAAVFCALFFRGIICIKLQETFNKRNTIF